MVVANISDFRKDIKSYFDRVALNFEIFATTIIIIICTKICTIF